MHSDLLLLAWSRFAREAFASWSATPAEVRATVLLRAADAPPSPAERPHAVPALEPQALPRALRVHPATDTLLRYVSPEIDWVLLGIDERWRKDLRVVFRKRPERALLKMAG